MRAFLSKRSAVFLTIAVTIGLLAYAQNSFQAGYAILRPVPGSPAPVATALLRTVNAAGVLIGETSMRGVRPIRSGRVYVDELSARTGLVFVNPSDQAATVTLILRSSSGSEVSRRTLSLEAHRHTAQFAAELFGSTVANFQGSLTFESTQPIACAALRQILNAAGEAAYTAIPAIDSTADTAPALVPHIRVGDGYTTQLVLLNHSAETARGRVRLFGNSASETVYEIPADGMRLVQPGGSAPFTGYAEVAPESGSATPGVMALVQSASAGFVSEAVVPQVLASRGVRVLVETTGTQTELDVANPNVESAELTFTLLDRFGSPISVVTRTLASRGYLSANAEELFPSVSRGFLGQIEMESALPFSAVAIRSTTNSRRDSILSSLPVTDLTSQATGLLVLPHIAIGSVFSTRLILTNPNAGAPAAGQIEFIQPDGTLARADAWQISARGSRQFFPGNTAPVSALSLRDPVSNEPASEITVNEGGTVRPNVLVIDSSGMARDDFAILTSVTNPDVASVDSTGAITGRSAGFSTLTVAAGGNVQTATITVVDVESGAGGYDITGVAVDSARKLYLASSTDHTILLAQDLRQPPAVWAGTVRASGFKDDLRLASQFHSPSYLALNQATGSVYVGDSENHVIRQIRSGATGRVSTVAGSGGAGDEDGVGRATTFRNPKGVAVDDRGYLWVADSGNHTIRRINILTGQVTTVAGNSGVEGQSDGRGSAALFRSPAGIAFEPESVAEQLLRERQGGTRQVRMIVADTGNGLIRRVSENGDVETIAQAAVASNRYAVTASADPAKPFHNPAGVAVDAAGTIYVAEEGDVRAILPTGGVVRTTQAGTLAHPRGLAANVTGQLVIADSGAGPQQIRFGEPQILAVTPDRISSRGGSRVTVRGRNFAPGTIVILAGTVIRDITIVDTENITFVAPPLSSGLTTLTIQTRGGLAQREFLIDAIPLRDLPPGSITTIVGGTTFSGDGGKATNAPIANPEQTAIDPAGNIYITDTANNRIRRVDAGTGLITTVAGNGDLGFSGDGGPAIAAKFNFPSGIALDGTGNLYISDMGNGRIRKVDALSGIISTVAGNLPGFSGDDGPAASSRLNAPRGLTFDSAGNLFVADSTNHRIRKVTPSGLISTVAGNGEADWAGDNGPATAAALNSPRAVTVDSAGNLWIADTFNGRIRRVDANGVIRTVNTGNLGAPRGVAVAANGDLFVSDSGNHRILRVDGFGNVSIVAGTGTAGFSGDGGLATAATLTQPHGIGIDGAGILVIADRGNNRIRRIAEGGVRLLTPYGLLPGPSTITTVAGNGQMDYPDEGGPATAAKLRSPGAVVSDAQGNVFVADSSNHRIRRVDAATGIITSVAGSGSPGFGGDEGQATESSINFPQGLAIDNEGSLYIADSNNNRVRKVTRDGLIRTVAGPASLSFPAGLALDRSGNLYIADSSNHRITRLDRQTGVMTAVAGDGLSSPQSIAFDAAGNLYIADTGNNRIRRIDARSQIIQTVAGTGSRGYSGDGGPALSAALNGPLSVAVDSGGSVLILDTFNQRLRRMDAVMNIIQTIAGTGMPGFSGDNGPATQATLWSPSQIAVDQSGNILIADTVNHRIRAIVRTQ